MLVKNINSEEVVKLYVQEKLSIRNVAKQVGCSTPTVKKVLVNNEVVLRSRGRQPKNGAHAVS
jgi:transposase